MLLGMSNLALSLRKLVNILYVWNDENAELALGF